MITRTLNLVAVETSKYPVEYLGDDESKQQHLGSYSLTLSVGQTERLQIAITRAEHDELLLLKSPLVNTARFVLMQDFGISGHFALFAWNSQVPALPSETYTGLISAPDHKSMEGILRQWASTLTVHMSFEIILRNRTRFQRVGGGIASAQRLVVKWETGAAAEFVIVRTA